MVNTDAIEETMTQSRTSPLQLILAAALLTLLAFGAHSAIHARMVAVRPEEPSRSTTGNPGIVHRIELAPNGGARALRTTSGVRIDDLTSGRIIADIPRAKSAAFSPDSSLVAIGLAEAVQIVRVASGEEAAQFALGPHPRMEQSRAAEQRLPEGMKHTLEPMSFFVFSPDSRRVVVVRQDLPNVTLWDIASSASIWSVPLPGEIESEPAFSPDGEIIVVAFSGSERKEKTLTALNASDGSRRGELTISRHAYIGRPRFVGQTPTLIATLSDGPPVLVADFSDPDAPVIVEGSPLNAIAPGAVLSPDLRYAAALISANDARVAAEVSRNFIAVTDLTTGAEVLRTEPVHALNWDAVFVNGSTLITATSDGSVHRLSIDDPEQVQAAITGEFSGPWHRRWTILLVSFGAWAAACAGLVLKSKTAPAPLALIGAAGVVGALALIAMHWAVTRGIEGPTSITTIPAILFLAFGVLLVVGIIAIARRAPAAVLTVLGVGAATAIPAWMIWASAVASV